MAASREKARGRICLLHRRGWWLVLVADADAVRPDGVEEKARRQCMPPPLALGGVWQRK